MNLKSQNDDYLIFGGGRTVNLTEYLTLQLLEDVSVDIRQAYTGRCIFSASGKLVKEKVAPKYYLFYIGDRDLDTLLWNNVGVILNVNINNISKS